MITDATLVLSDSQAITATASLTNIIDNGSTGIISFTVGVGI